ncbi:MAG TPA: NAD(P)/FAD-dependent oxidoreductase [Chromatiaceae bacterium]|nr:NAD(P)/FAD-dependent oxidoreductase [Chromatiaceae bacterium]
MTDKINRRRFLQFSAASLLGATASAAGAPAGPDTSPATPFIAGLSSRQAPLPRASGPRVVVVGGGWAGLTLAKYLKRFQPKFDVVLIDRHALFVSCPLSNLWMAQQIPLEFLAHSYLDAARNNDYLFFNATVIDLDRGARRLHTEQGYIHYDYLVLAPGIDYDYARLGVDDPADEYALRTDYPAGFTGASELLTIKNKLQGFKGGTFLLTVPAGNYRCMAAPYERACMAAAIFRKRGIKGRVLLLDMNPDVRIKRDGFLNAFKTFYPDIIQYETSVGISAIDPRKRELSTDFDDYGFDDAAIYPPVRASRLLERLELADMNTPQKEARIDPFKYHLLGDEHVYICGDARSQPFSKSGNTANSEAKYVAEVIVAHADGRAIPWRSPQTMCFSGVHIDPLEAMSIIAFYRYDKRQKTFAFDRTHMVEKWSARIGQAGLAWGEGMYRDMFYG